MKIINEKIKTLNWQLATATKAAKTHPDRDFMQSLIFDLAVKLERFTFERNLK